MNGKIDSYVGFAIKKGAVVFGVDEIERYHKKVYLILNTCDLAKKSLERLLKSSERLKCKLVEIAPMEVLKNKNCKAIAICDKSLADVILKIVSTTGSEETNG